ncbi:RNA 2',3'-cyclic phosphodiesterase [Psychrobium sp. 1_MG-2023]|uniref:RNA 2',3'-cyclic phosphodiesterase n=1 Tax=Psychrobium sp. 1_MG-2023 TaxID=3062624 RepID=UPI000C32187B|nr:RNA 2',3'-cyclic phosphodiesterase [Psychrobium sp. 1_MG-2023]MDP2559745.1 RNA 2',3'-cyclic phosphodiesterase [Psychrobium sp. 1_MG-2023]PKF59145.1 RNA 2',3'-cyclic phosphodiesterase [Alteromonadales bacterium alter-6D02]
MIYRKLFFAIKPASPQLEQLTQLQRQCDGFGRPLPQQNLHMTLYFIGPVEQSKQSLLISAINSTQWPAFHVCFNHLELWPKQRILCLTSGKVAPNLQRVTKQLYEIGAQLGLPAPHYDFNPHITLLRKAHCKPELKTNLCELVMTAVELLLYESVSEGHGVSYRVLNKWPLLNDLT